MDVVAQMKTLHIALCLALVSTGAFIGLSLAQPPRHDQAEAQPTFFEGWLAGWQAGYEAVFGRGYGAPPAPQPPFVAGQASTWSDGYTLGVIAGAAAAREEQARIKK